MSYLNVVAFTLNEPKLHKGLLLYTLVVATLNTHQSSCQTDNSIYVDMEQLLDHMLQSNSNSFFERYCSKLVNKNQNAQFLDMCEKLKASFSAHFSCQDLFGDARLPF